MFKKKSDINQLVNSLFLASSILIFHVILLAGLAILVLFFRGIVSYVFWIFLGGCALIIGSAYFFFKYMQKKGGRTIFKILSLPEFKGRKVEVRLLGGLASLKIGGTEENQSVIDSDVLPVSHQIEDSQAVRLRELTELARLLEKNLITLDEFQKAKQSLFNS
jgi:hypothetical protein